MPDPDYLRVTRALAWALKPHDFPLSRPEVPLCPLSRKAVWLPCPAPSSRAPMNGLGQPSPGWRFAGSRDEQRTQAPSDWSRTGSGSQLIKCPVYCILNLRQHWLRSGCTGQRRTHHRARTLAWIMAWTFSRPVQLAGSGTGRRGRCGHQRWRSRTSQCLGRSSVPRAASCIPRQRIRSRVFESIHGEVSG